MYANQTLDSRNWHRRTGRFSGERGATFMPVRTHAVALIIRSESRRAKPAAGTEKTVSYRKFHLDFECAGTTCDRAQKPEDRLATCARTIHTPGSANQGSSRKRERRRSRTERTRPVSGRLKCRRVGSVTVVESVGAQRRPPRVRRRVDSASIAPSPFLTSEYERQDSSLHLN